MATRKMTNIQHQVKQSWEDTLEQFLFWKKAEGLSIRTVEDYRKTVSYFFRRYPDSFDDSLLKKNLLEYMGLPVKPAYYNLKLVYLKAFLNWCVKEDIISVNPLSDLKKKKAEGRIVNIDESDLRILISLPDKKTFAGLRDYALIMLTLDTGIRPNEALSLLISDINVRFMEVYVRCETAKTRTSRTLPILPITAEAIKRLITARYHKWDNCIPVFCTCDGAILSRPNWWDRMRIYSEKLGTKISPYALRHAFALEYLRNGGHALALQRTLGHTDLSMTKRYVALTDQDLRMQHEIASPLKTILTEKNRIRKVR